MIYTPLSLNGAWEMDYDENIYLGTENPFKEISSKIDYAGTEPESITVSEIKNAVPAYWEDMTEAFSETSFFCKLKFNPEYGIRRYPIAGYAPDMALPNIMGNFFYRRTFLWNDVHSESVIHFGGVQNAVSVWINDEFLGRHSGYSTPFDIKIPDGVLKQGENTIVLSVSNYRLKGYEGEPISGLTSRAANEYTGGITGDVELRTYNCALRDAVILVSEDCKTVRVEVESEEQITYNWAVYDNDRLIKNGSAEKDFSFDTVGLELWSPENPKLYMLEVSHGSGSLQKVFGVRRLTAAGTHLSLNGNAYFLRGACEHCYFPETIHPSHDLAYYKSVIKNLKNLGFNFVRFHTFVPEEEYMQAADELGMLFQVECPNNTTAEEWESIVRFCRNHTCVVIYCCGNELMIDDLFITYLNKCADFVHANTDSMFAPMSAMRGVEYFWSEPEQLSELCDEPFTHHPRRMNSLGKFSDLYCTYPDGAHSYFSYDCNPAQIDENSKVYNKPRLSHEICIDGTYTDLSLKDRYKGLRVGKTEMFSSIEQHLQAKGILKKAPVYFKNSSQWQRRIRKYCFESLRHSREISGYDFLGPIDTHWHTMGYDVGMMNEFYELKPGETLRNVLMYNSPTVLLTDLGKKTNFASGETLTCNIFVSHYGGKDLHNAQLTLRLSSDDKVIERKFVEVEQIKNGDVSKLFCFSVNLPYTDASRTMKLYVTLDCEEIFAENEWELYLFPIAKTNAKEGLIVSEGMTCEELLQLLDEGKNVLLLGAKPFVSIPTTFRIALAGRTSGNFATIVADHPALGDIPHDGFCGWQFAGLLEGGSAVCFECDDVPFNPIIEVASSHKYVIRQAAMFEFNALNGKLLVCSMNFDENDPAARRLKSQLIAYAQSEKFMPRDTVDKSQILSLINSKVRRAAANTNLAFNPNDKTAMRRKK